MKLYELMSFQVQKSQKGSYLGTRATTTKERLDGLKKFFCFEIAALFRLVRKNARQIQNKQSSSVHQYTYERYFFQDDIIKIKILSKNRESNVSRSKSGKIHQ